MKKKWNALFWLFAVVLGLGACATLPEGGTAPRPRLVVLLVVDGLPQRQVTDYRHQFGPDGFRRFLERGTWFHNAHYGHAFTVTAAGHAVMLTGAYPHRTGIIGNDWRDPATGEVQYNTGDPDHGYIGHKTGKLDGTSPRNLRAETLGDVLKSVNPASKVIGISGKDRGAILPAGKSGTAYMYQAQTGRFASSTYYMKEHPAWVEQFHASNPADAYFHRVWEPVFAQQEMYKASLPDEQKWYRAGGKLPKRIGEGQEKPGPAYYAELLRSPFGDELTLDFARAAIAAEGLGRDDVPDILSVSLSTHDYVNHAYGAESRLSHDHVLHLDRLLEAFFRDLDATVGKDQYIAVLTADHGFMPAPEYSQMQGRASGRQSGSQMLARINAGLAKKFGEGQWIRALSASALLYNRALLAERKVDRAEFDANVRELAQAEPGVAHTYTRDELMAEKPAATRFHDKVKRTWYPERSADMHIVLKPYWMYNSTSSTTTHGSPYPYDTNAPLLFYGPAWTRPGRVDAAL